MLTKSQKSAFKTIKFGFGYLYPFPVEWDLQQSQLIISTKNLKPFFIMLALNFIVTTVDFYVPLSNLFIKPRKDYHMINIPLHIFAGLIGITALLVTGIFYKEKSFVNGFNQLLILKHRLYSGTQHTNN